MKELACVGALLLAGILLLPACSQDSRDADSSPSTPSAPSRPPPTSSPVPNIAGTFRGPYFIIGELSGNDGVMTWVIQQSGTRLTGTFTIQRDLILGNVSGTLTGSAAAEAGTTPNHYSLTLTSSSVSGFPGCVLVLNAEEYSLADVPRQLNGIYKQALCGQTSNLENGVYQLNRQ